MLSLLPALLLAGAHVCAAQGPGQPQNTFDWSQLKASSDITWVPCNDHFQCARISVPLDYTTPKLGSATIAVMRLPASVPPTDPTYRGPVFFNPGGPGASGVQSLLGVGPFFTSVFGAEFDYVSFDPRGIGFSTPTTDFFASAAETALWNAGNPSQSLNASSDSTAVARFWGLSQVQGQLAAQHDSTGILKYLTTDNAARDMHLINQKLGFKKVRYYGISYGSVLGATFAALFPDKIERMILDGVLDADGWYQANLTIQASATDATLDSFFTSCAAAGPSLCPFSPSTSSTAQDLSNRLTTLTNTILAQPVPVITPGGYGLVDYSRLRQTLFQALYAPYVFFPPLAQALADLEKGNGTSLFAILAQPQFTCGAPAPDGTQPTGNPLAATFGVQCGDAVEVKDSLEQLDAYYRNAAKLSQFAEFLVGSGRITCSGWKIHRQNRFKWPVSNIKTSFPLLFVANTADPVTPKQSAQKTRANFLGSALLVQDSPGHTSTTAPSLCTFGYFKAYMTNGTLPPPDTTCPVDAQIFGGGPPDGSGPVTAAKTRVQLSKEDQDTLQVLKSIGDVLRPIIARW
ncbi:Alpha beta hydrolase fold family [Mycena indigotica]|uniref:Alpha beta hydrolase fold family n=1 Tax=Mycena indigotica TaxID=2126181 RepID=A0A8H6W396_9AGAR|nr:Alpha beta hydrolase fold family [Mycena indigotica]KAF7304004.1 Alpha beta hydrolase fold family [Mycena indigotica]